MDDNTAADDNAERTRWLSGLATELAVDPALLEPASTLLDLARDAAHTAGRPAAPLTTFLVGLAAGARGGTPAGLESAMATALRYLTPEAG
jgi:hypothetical protein